LTKSKSKIKHSKFKIGPVKAFLSVAALACFVMLFVGGPDYYSSRSFKTAWGLGHIFAFAIWSFILVCYWSKLREMEFYLQGLWLLGIALIIGVVTEFIQIFVGRTPLLTDLLRDLEGVAFVLAFLSPARKLISKIKLRSLQIVILGIIIFESYPLAIVLADEIVARNQFPVLADFETPFETSRTDSQSASRTDKISKNGKHSIAVTLTTDLYSGIGLKYFPGDWSDYAYLNFSVYNPENMPLRIICRVNDRAHVGAEQLYEDRFNRSFELHEGWNNIKISLGDIANAPKDRKMNMQKIQGFGIFAIQLPEPRVIYLDYIHLSRS